MICICAYLRFFREKDTPIAIVPTGSIEQHGPDLPLSVDYRCPEYVAEMAAGKVMKAHDIHVLVDPPVQLGDPTVASRETGEKILEASSDDLARMIIEIARYQE